MAIKLDKQTKGITANYWRINNFNYDDKNDRVSIVLALYYNEAATSNLDNQLFQMNLNFDGVREMAIPNVGATNVRDLIKGMLYVEIKKSKIEQREVVDDKGKIVIEDVETNPFVYAEDC